MGKKKLTRPEPPDPFINGWAVVSHGHRILHAVLFPTDLGDFGPALCGVGPINPNGWVEIPDEAPFYRFRCSPCCNKLRVMYESDDDRLTRQDRFGYETILDEYKRSISVDT